MFRGNSKLKGPKESTGRALVNCASGKYRSSPIKLTSLDMSLEHWCRANSCRCRSYIDQLPPVKFIAWARPPGFFYHASAWKKFGVSRVVASPGPADLHSGVLPT